MKKLGVILIISTMICCEESSNGEPVFGPLIFKIYDTNGELFIENHEDYNYSDLTFETVYDAYIETWDNDTLIAVQQQVKQFIFNFGNGDIDTLDVIPIPEFNNRGRYPEYPEKIILFFNSVLQDTIDFDLPPYDNLNNRNAWLHKVIRTQEDTMQLIIIPLIKGK